MDSPQTISIMFFFLIVIIVLDYVSAQSPPPPPPPLNPYRASDLFKPKLAVITGVFSIVFTLTFVLLVYARCFQNDLRSEMEGDDGDRTRYDRLWRGLFDRSFRFSGLDKTAIESLPFFRFSALKGLKQGLECSVCLSKFKDVEILRLLPKCRHAFHIRCIDQWLEQHATCPLCRNRVNIEDDLYVLGPSCNSLSIENQSQTRGEDSSLDVYIEREEENSDGSSRFSSFRKILKKSLFLERQGDDEIEEKKAMHKFNHRIVVSHVVFKNRWSDVTSSDLTVLTSEMMNSLSSDRFSSMDRVQRGDLQDKEMKRIMLKNKDSSRRTVSEITTFRRENSVGGNYGGSAASTSQNDAVTATTEERRRRLWLPIVRRTAHLFVNREKRNTTRQSLNV